MIEIEKPKVDIIELSEDYRYGKFVIEPLERGYGITIGNALRRILLSSLPGAAVNAIKVEGVLHEFSTVPGVKEDVTEIILTLKELSANIDGEGNRTLKIEAQGPCTITGADIICPPDVEILSKDLKIATLDDNAKFNMDIFIDKGRGYVSAEENKTEHMPIGVLPVDSIYTPVEKVSYHVENTRVGQKTDYDKLVLDVWTNGSINPQEGISLAAKVLVEHLNLFIDLTEHVSNVEIMVEKEEDQKEKVLEMTIEELDLSVRSYNCLKRAGINTVEELANKSEDDMM
ncbi:MAG TPA: DNA-directed RNA polymerase subunit alpha, partial [Peptostreptococcaceae bacterium]|nr:DNA-directed RNA polymerase subunit alpha [Peptostreptococcaceae bacterium]